LPLACSFIKYLSNLIMVAASSKSSA